MQMREDRPPFVKFEWRAVENRQASQEAGHYVAKDIAYAIVTPAGSKDRYENQVDDWFRMLEFERKENRFPPDWLQYYRNLYNSWLADEAPVELGTALRNWPVLSPAQLRMCQEVHLRTIEDLAIANEETLSRLGMAGRTLKQKAQDWLESSKHAGKQTEEMTALRVMNERLMQEVQDLRARVEAIPKEPVRERRPVKDDIKL